MNQHKSLFIQLFSILILLFTSTQVTAKSVSSKILMVVSSHGENKGETAPGYEFDEFSKAYLIFKQHGITVDVASPKGGSVEADKYDPSKPYNAKVLADKTIMRKLNNSITTKQIDASLYDGIFIVGGKGAMFDLPKDGALQQVIADVYQQKGTVAAVCHGPAALVDVQLADGSYLIANKAVNGFTNKEEKLFGKKWIKEFNFMLEDKLVERGGKFQANDIMLSHVAVDKRLITGQNPSSTVAVAVELVKSLGFKVQTMPQYKDDQTLAMVAKILQGDTQAAQIMSSNQEKYHIALAGMYGFYYLKTTNNEQNLRHALTLMSLAKETINNPTLDMQIAKTQHKLGDKQAAIATLNQLLANKPGFQPALDMLKSLFL